MGGGGGLEREVKVRVDCGALGELASRLGAGPPVVEEDVYYRHPCRDFAATDEALRLRVSRRPGGGVEARLAYKGPRLPDPSGAKVRFEAEAWVEGPVDVVLERLGFQPAVRVVKRRRYAEFEGHTVTLDDVEGLGCFVEVEGPSPWEALRRLGVEGEPVEKTYLEMVLETRGRRARAGGPGGG